MKNIVLDTNILLTNPDCITEGFEENNIIIPLTVIEEMDDMKKESSSRGYSARQSLRLIDDIREGHDIKKGAPRNDKGGLLRVVTLNNKEIEKYNKNGLSMDKKDDLIILSTEKIKQEDEGIKTIIVSNDTALRIKCTLLDISAEHYRDITVKKQILEYKGYRTISLPLSFYGDLKTDDKGKHHIVIKPLPEEIELDDVGIDEKDIYPNEFILIDCEDSGNLSKKDSKQLKAVYRYRNGVLNKRDLNFKGLYGNIGGKNLEQSCAMDLLISDDVPVVSLKSLAGAGKTFTALSIAMTKVIKEKNSKFEKIIFLKPTVSIGTDIGFLPGSMHDKLAPFMGSFLDNINLLRKMEVCQSKSSSGDAFEDLLDQGVIEIESIAFVRGRTFNNCIIIADEMQNVDASICKTIMSRIGENCRVFCLGDVDQVDTPYLSKTNNGLAHLVRKFRGQDIFGHVTMTKCERSAVARAAAELL